MKKAAGENIVIGEHHSRGRKTVYGRWRFAVLTGAFLLILSNPFLNYFLHVNLNKFSGLP